MQVDVTGFIVLYWIVWLVIVLLIWIAYLHLR